MNEVKTKDKEKDKKPEDNEADLGTLNGNWMLINGLVSPQYSGAVYEDSRESSSVLRRSIANLSALCTYDNITKLRHHI